LHIFLNKKSKLHSSLFFYPRLATYILGTFL
jgi:hypothetical protein